MNVEPICYVGRKPCGCIVAALSYYPPASKWTAQELAQWVREGLIIERSTSEIVRAHFVGESGCPHKPQQPALFEVMK